MRKGSESFLLRDEPGILLETADQDDIEPESGFNISCGLR